MSRERWSGPDRSTSRSRQHPCRRQAPLHGASGATPQQIICPQRHCGSTHRLIQWHVTEVYGRNGVGVGEDAAKIVFLGLTDLKTGSSETANAPTMPMSAPGGLTRRFWGTASANRMPVTSSRDQSPLTQWRVAELYGVQRRPRRRRCCEECVVWADRLKVQRRRVRRVHLCRRQAPLHGVSGATRPQIICPKRHCGSIHRLIQWHVTDLYGRNGVGGSRGAAKIVYSVCFDGFLTEAVQRRRHMLPARRPCEALLGHRVCKWNARDVIARSITAKYNGASPNFTPRNGVGVGEDAAKTGLLGFPRSVCGPCPDFLTTNAHASERNFLVQQFCESSVTPHLALAAEDTESQILICKLPSSAFCLYSCVEPRLYRSLNTREHLWRPQKSHA